jgi:uncharacterized protein with HEPN domain
MRESALLIREYVASVTRDEFLTNVQLQDSVLRRFQVIGEAARRISEETKIRYPEIRWRDIVGMRHRLVHDYVDVDLDIVWNAAKNRVPQLLEQLARLEPPRGS